MSVNSGGVEVLKQYRRMQKAAPLVESGLILGLLGMVLWQRYQRTLKHWWKTWRAKPKRPWTLQPRTPDDCQACQLAEAEVGPSRSQGRRPWSEEKSRWGRPKEHDSSGQARMNGLCDYKDTDPDFHALRWDGQRNKCEATDQWECGACEKKHTARLGTPLYQLKTAKERVTLATHLVCGSVTSWLMRKVGAIEMMEDARRAVGEDRSWRGHTSNA